MMSFKKTNLHIIKGFSKKPPKLARFVNLFVWLLVLSYFAGVAWFLLCELARPEDQESESFAAYFDEVSPIQTSWALTYFAFTSLSTVGLGDLHP